jgi:hypothetical protein
MTEPEPPPVGQAVADFLGQGDDPGIVALASEIVPVVTELARAYTRDRGFTAGKPNSQVGAVIVTASARLVANPEQLPTDVGSVSIRGGFNGWTLAERATLDRFRVKAM